VLPGGSEAGEHARLSAASVAWLLALPLALAGAAVVWLLGPPLSDVLYPPPSSFDFLAADAQPIAPEPVESMRYLLAIAAATLPAAATIALVRRRRPRDFPAAAALVAAAQGAGVAFVVLCLAAQHAPRWGTAYFGATALAAAVVLALALLAALRSATLRVRVEPWLRETRRARIGLLALAVAIAAIWVLPALNTETSMTWAYGRLEGAFPFDEAFAVLNGLTPWVDLNVQYAALVPLLSAAAMLALGKTTLVFTLVMCVLTAVALLAIYGVFRRVTGSSLAALALFAAFVPMSLFANPPATVRFTPGTYFGMFPLRFVGPYALAWLLARRLERPDRRAWPLLLAGGLVLVNNLDFGLVALAATLAALALTEPRALPRLAREAAAGIGAALLLYALFALVRSGALPDPTRGIEFSRLYGVAGYSVAPLPGVLGLPLVIFLTYAAALAVAAVRALDGAPNRVLTGMLAWSGVFGLGSGAYYAARSGLAVLPMMFSAWALALLLLTVPVVRQLARDPRARPGIAALAVLCGCGLALTTIVQLPPPWRQLERIEAPTGPLEPLPPESWARPAQDPEVREFVASVGDGPGRFVVRSGAPVGIFTTTGHRTADAYDVVNAIPFTGPESIHTVQQREAAFDALRDAGGNTALVPPEALPLLLDGLRLHGFALLTASGPVRDVEDAAALPADALVVGGLTKWVDLRRPRAPWLRGGA
jgi:hypothetical protein